MPVLTALLGFNLLILVHELGHLIAARLVGLPVRRLSVGFGPALYHFYFGETRYQLSLVPFGGFVEIEGLTTPLPDPEAEFWGEASTTPPALSRWARAFVALAGPAANFLAAIFLYGALFATGSSLSYKGFRLSSVTLREVTGPAAVAGLQAGDVIEMIDGASINDFAALRAKVGASEEGATLKVRYARPPSPKQRAWVEESVQARCEALAREKTAGQLSTKQRSRCESFEGLTLYTPTAEESWPRAEVGVTVARGKRGLKIGVTPEMSRFAVEGADQIVMRAFGESWRFFSMLGGKLWAGLRGKEPLEVSSVVHATAIGADSVRLGPEWFLNLLAFLSLNLCLLNLLPLPGLDGGRLFLLGAEGVSGRPLPLRVERAIQLVGIVVLLGLSLTLSLRDLLSILKTF